MTQTAAYPPVGQVWIFDIGVAQIEHHFISHDEMHYRILTGSMEGAEETVRIAVEFIRPEVFLVSWQEANKNTVVHVEDFANGTFHSLLTTPEGHFYRTTGPMWLRPEADEQE